MEDESQTGQKPDKFEPAVDPEELREGKVFWVETQDGSRLKIDDTETLRVQGPPWTVEATTSGSGPVIVGEYDSKETAELAIRYIVRDSENQAAGKPIDPPNYLSATSGGHYDNERVRKRYQVETTPLDGE